MVSVRFTGFDWCLFVIRQRTRKLLGHFLSTTHHPLLCVYLGLACFDSTDNASKPDGKCEKSATNSTATRGERT